VSETGEATGILCQRDVSAINFVGKSCVSISSDLPPQANNKVSLLIRCVLNLQTIMYLGNLDCPTVCCHEKSNHFLTLGKP